MKNLRKTLVNWRNAKTLALAIGAGASALTSASAFDIPKGFENYKKSEWKDLGKKLVDFTVKGRKIYFYSELMGVYRKGKEVPYVIEFYVGDLSEESPIMTWFDINDDCKPNSGEMRFNESFDENLKAYIKKRYGI